MILQIISTPYRHRSPFRGERRLCFEETSQRTAGELYEVFYFPRLRYAYLGLIKSDLSEVCFIYQFISLLLLVSKRQYFGNPVQTTERSACGVITAIYAPRGAGERCLETIRLLAAKDRTYQL
ncbi:MAG: hypothetical protein J5862_03745 [Bacteroidales bacterium]|nr:hypothetical protein [Bacteroidales bacterium]